MELRKQIIAIAEQLITDSKHFLVEVVISKNTGDRKITVILDGDLGVTIDDCAALSRGIITKLDESGVRLGEYTLNVSSPGLDFPLKLKRQYYKNLGRVVKVTTVDKTVKTGELVQVEENAIKLQETVKDKKIDKKIVYDIPFETIRDTRVMVSFK